MSNKKKPPALPGQKGWKFVWKDLVTSRSDVSRRAKAVGGALCDHAHSDGSSAFPSIGRMAARTGYSRRSVQLGLVELQKLGLITKVKRRGRFPAVDENKEPQTAEDGTARGSYPVEYKLTVPTDLGALTVHDQSAVECAVVVPPTRNGGTTTAQRAHDQRAVQCAQIGMEPPEEVTRVIYASTSPLAREGEDDH